jgi:hypothetical protein
MGEPGRTADERLDKTLQETFPAGHPISNYIE